MDADSFCQERNRYFLQWINAPIFILLWICTEPLVTWDDANYLSGHASYWAQWTPWTQCSSSCGQGKQSRKVSIDTCLFTISIH